MDPIAEEIDTTEQKKGLMSSILSAIGPNEADAGIIGNAFKAATKKGAKSLASNPLASRAEDLLIGGQFQGKTITQISKGASQWRHIHLDDDTVVPVTKDVVADMVRAAGTKQYTDKLPNQGEVSQLAQAYRSLQYHLQRANLLSQNKVSMRRHFQAYRDQLKQAGSFVPDLSLVSFKGKVMSIPTEYATILEKEETEGFKLLERLK